MRTIETFVLRLLIDTEEPDALRGAVRSVIDAEEHSFADKDALIGVLRRMIGRIAEAEAREQDQEEGCANADGSGLRNLKIS